MKIGIIGAGASGLACAVSIAKSARYNKIPVDITVFESKDKPGKKILATGNGRCNLMNSNSGDFYFDKNNFSSFALQKYNVTSNLDFFASLGLYTRSDEEGRIYPLSNQASSVLDALRFSCQDLGVKVATDYEIKAVRCENGVFLLNGDIKCDVVVLACGGKAAVKNFNGYELLRKVGHKVIEPLPSLTKFEITDKKTVKQLKGIKQKGEFSLISDNTLMANEKGELLFTDYGLSGIAIMQLSAFATRVKSKLIVQADFVSELDFTELFNAIYSYASSNKTLKNENLLSGFVSKRLGEVIIKSVGLELSGNASELSVKKIKEIAHKLKNFSFEISSLRGFDDAQVTAGGADTSYFNKKTMESKKVRGLYCIGELLDVDGLCGGYNLMWAWSSARACAEAIINNELNRKGY